MNAVITKHKLDFEVAPWNDYIMLFKVGTCHGQWMNHPIMGLGFGRVLCLISVVNDDPGNGHLDDVFEWFEGSAERQKIPLMIMDFFNDDFKQHCINKRGYTEIPGTDHVVKFF